MASLLYNGPVGFLSQVFQYRVNSKQLKFLINFNKFVINLINSVFVEGWLQDNSFQLFPALEVHALMDLQYQQGLSLIFSQQSTQGEEYTDVTKTLTYVYI